MSKILVVDDDKDFIDDITDDLQKVGHVVYNSKNVEAAKNVLKKEKFDYTVIDLKMKDNEDESSFSGFDLVDYISTNKINTKPIIYTSHSKKTNMITSLKKGAAKFLQKEIANINLLNELGTGENISISSNKAINSRVSELSIFFWVFVVISSIISFTFLTGKSKILVPSLITTITVVLYFIISVIFPKTGGNSDV